MQPSEESFRVAQDIARAQALIKEGRTPAAQRHLQDRGMHFPPRQVLSHLACSLQLSNRLLRLLCPGPESASAQLLCALWPESRWHLLCNASWRFILVLRCRGAQAPLAGFSWVDHTSLVRVDRMHLDGKGNLERMGLSLLHDDRLDDLTQEDLARQLDVEWQQAGTRPAQLHMQGLAGLEQKRTARGITILMACLIVPLSVHMPPAATALAGEHAASA